MPRCSRLSSTTNAIVLIALFLVITTTTTIFASINYSQPEVTLKQFQAIAIDAYDYPTAGLTNPQRLYEQKHFSQLLGATGLTTSTHQICLNIESELHAIQPHGLGPEVINKALYLGKMADFYNCKSITISPQLLVVLDALILSDTLIEINTGVSLYYSLFNAGVAGLDRDRYDWSDIMDLLQSLTLVDGLSRSSVSTLSPSVRNTIMVIDIAAQVMELMPESQKSSFGDSITNSLSEINSTVSILAAGICQPNNNIAFSVGDYADFIKGYGLLYRNFQNHQSLPLPLQCITSQTQSALNSDKFSSIYAAARYIDVVLTAVKGKAIQCSDYLTNSPALFFFTSPFAATTSTPSSLTIPVTGWEILGLLQFGKPDQTKIGAGDDVDVILGPQTGINLVAPGQMTKMVQKFPLKALFAANSIKFESISAQTPISGSLQLTVTATGDEKKVIFTAPIYISSAPSSSSTFQLSPNAPFLSTDKPFLTIDTDSTTKKILGGVAKTNPTRVSIDLSTQLQFEVTLPSAPQTAITSIRMIACGSKNCEDVMAVVNDAKNNFIAAFFSPITKLKSVATIYLTAPQTKALILAQTNPSKGGNNYVVVLDHVDLETKQTQTYGLTMITTTVSNPQLFSQFYTAESFQATPTAMAMTDANASNNNKRSFLWSLVEPHFHTFSVPGKTGNPFLATIFIGAIIAATAVFIMIFLGVFRPYPNLTTKLAYPNFLVFTGALGLVLAGLVIYWFKMTLFEVMLPASLLALPIVIAISLPLRESVSSLRIFNLLYTDNGEGEKAVELKKKQD